MKNIYPAVMYVDDHGTYVVNVPDIPGCITTARTAEEAYENICDALQLSLVTMEDFEDPIPEASAPEAVSEEGKFILMVPVDTVRYREETDNRAVRKSVSMPAWLSTMADKKGLNCSKLLQNAIRAELGIQL